MEQVARTVRGYERLTVDPAASPSLALPGEVAADLKRSLVDKYLATASEATGRTGCVPVRHQYATSTSNVLAEEAVLAATHPDGEPGSIAALACPEVFLSLREAHPNREHDWLLEFDPRYKDLGNTTILPLDDVGAVPPHLHHAFDVVVGEVLMGLPKMVELCKLLARPHQTPKFILIGPAGPTCQQEAEALGLRQSGFMPLGKADARVYTTLPHSKRLHL